MKKITLLLCLVSLTGIAQIKGNKTIETKTYNVSGLEHVKINLYAKVTIDASSNSETMEITADSNLFDYIEKTVVEGVLHLDQKEWISASQNIIINIGAPNLKRLESGTHDTTKIINFNNNQLRVNAPVGNIIIEGKTKELRLGAELATIDASKIEADNVYVNLWSRGRITVNPKTSLWAEVTDDGKLVYISKPPNFDVKTKRNGMVLSTTDKDKIKNPEAQFIKFRIKNNSTNRNHFYVVGPKPDGSRFSYGFPMMPNSKRQENWSVGTKVYKVNALGIRKLLVKIKKEDENKTVNLF